MSAIHGQGNSAGSRQGCVPVSHSIPVNFNSTVNRKFLRVTASTAKPVRVTVHELGITAFNAGTTNQYRLGTTSGGAQLLALRNTPAAAADTAVPLLQAVFTADTDIWIGTSLTGTTPTTGAMYLTATLIELNVNDVNANAIP